MKPLCLSCGAGVNQPLVYNGIGDPPFVLGGWATAEFVVSIALHKLISHSKSFPTDDSNCSFLLTLI
jgi:hypothetical protein